MIFLDFETFVTDKYHLDSRRSSGMTTENYVRDEQFQATMLSFCENNGEPQSAAGPDAIGEMLAARDWSRETVVIHNAQFDAAVLSFIYGIVPGSIIDTLCVARGTFGLTENVGLGDLAERFGLPKKSVPYDELRGVRFENMPAELVERLRIGCENDVILLREIAKRLLPGFPKSELIVIDLTTRMFIEPTIFGDADMLRQLAIDERTRKVDTVNKLLLSIPELRQLVDAELAGQRKPKPTAEIAEGVFRSTKKFVALLESLGETVGTKANPKGKLIPAIDSKSIYMRDLMDRDGIIGDLANAKIDLGSQINESRSKRIFDKAITGRPLAIQLKPYGTVTARMSGAGDRLNYQNQPRDAKIRNCLIAPPGMKIVDIDLSQIEYRALCALAKQTDKLDALRAGRDVYSELATKLYGRTITKSDETAKERNVGKTATLSCGFGSGVDGKTFQQNCRKSGLKIPIDDAVKAVAIYRQTHPRVIEFWKECDRVLRYLMVGNGCAMVGPIRIERGALTLPNGLKLPYDMRLDVDSRTLLRRERAKTGGTDFKKTYGGKMAENLSSSISRVILTDIMLTIWSDLELRPFLTVHDSLCYLVPEGDAEQVAKAMINIAEQVPSWWQNGAPPIAVEAKIGTRYGSLKTLKIEQPDESKE
jgi:hypothetical protein